MAAGPFFNFALSILIFTCIFLFRGEITEPLTVGELRPLPVQQELMEGDVLVAIEGQAPPGSVEDYMARTVDRVEALLRTR